ncbi:acyl transferase/acyl hydrolase/lysophospholipase [Neohortaea acidophila]|uniref:Acyl transferase/acyl hydrolase/lysophospholipase n=1 Tax=Neohortaea acidophila TaxID=245834 RepID=A0A6A6PVR9_9PEZI|nr:acyl transferase/acyl hydrolase/lysophospholipase [Neohortaea acidophila]KAF2484268.1 acyl transferase/acyl hydrolase/lysophospholipase [Neohortaea acidophila]
MAVNVPLIWSYIWSALYILSGVWYFVPRSKRLVHRLRCSLFGDPELQRLRGNLDNARNYDEWSEAAFVLDQYLPGNLEWKLNPVSPLYHWQQLKQRIANIENALIAEDFNSALCLLQFGLVRGLGNIADERLYNRVYSGTKWLIKEYMDAMANLLDNFFEGHWKGGTLPQQSKMNYAERFRIAYSKTALVLQGGSIFGLYHIGVMKALHERDLLPKVILGTGTGALMAVLVGTCKDADLPNLLNGRMLDLTAFAARERQPPPEWYDVFAIFCKRLKRFYDSGYVLDKDALEKCVRDNVGDMTFREAHQLTGRIISISIECDSPGTPNCLNYITTPHILLRTAALASNESDPDIAPAMIKEKNSRGEIRDWSLNDETPAFRKLRRKRQRRMPIKDDVNAPLQRISQLENVNHFIISQARPYLVPFLAPSLHRSNGPRQHSSPWSLTSLKDWLIHAIGKDLAHRMHQVDRIWGLPRRLRRFLIDERVPFRSLTMVPEVMPSDFLRLLRNPRQAEIDYWIRLGEKSVWPCVAALKVRCEIEFSLEERYRIERRRPLHEIYANEDEEGLPRRRWRRVRSTSTESTPF